MNNRLAMETLGGNSYKKGDIKPSSPHSSKEGLLSSASWELGVQMHSHSVMGELHLFLGVQLMIKQ